MLRRRLFTHESYTDKSGWKTQVVSALNGICELDDQTKRQRAQEEERYTQAFPFHPYLTDVLFEKWTQLEGFQRTRGVLRTFASALRDAEKWGLTQISKARVQHGTYSFYFWDGDGNVWEILSNPHHGYSWMFERGDQEGRGNMRRDYARPVLSEE